MTDRLYRSYDFAAYAAAKPLETDPEGKWVHSIGTANIIARVVRQAAGKEYPRPYDFLRKELFAEIGMHSAVADPDSSGTFVGSSSMFATPTPKAPQGQYGVLFGLNAGTESNPK